MSSKNQAIIDALNSNLQHYPGYAQEPEWVMSIAYGSGPTYLTASDDQGSTKNQKNPIALKHFCPIYDYQFGLTRGFNNEAMTNDLVPTGLCAHELKIVAPFASISAGVQQAFAQNMLLGTLVLARLATVTNAPVAGSAAMTTVSKYTFRNLYITALVSKEDLICLSFRYTDIQYTKDSIDPKTGAAAGSSAVAYHNLANSAAGAE